MAAKHSGRVAEGCDPVVGDRRGGEFGDQELLKRRGCRVTGDERTGGGEASTANCSEGNLDL